MWYANPFSERKSGLYSDTVCNISPDHLKAIERGKRASSIDLLAEISITFDISLDYLILGKIQEKDSIKEELHKVIDVLERFKREL